MEERQFVGDHFDRTLICGRYVWHTRVAKQLILNYSGAGLAENLCPYLFLWSGSPFKYPVRGHAAKWSP